MELYKVEILGFKSFKDKVIIDVPEGVISIVGPNGCGKSNIVDAVKWALGEQNPRNLRARHMEDIVFAGTTEFPPLGMSEVSLHFRRASEPFPEPYSNLNDLVVTRRLYRSGESEYLINKSQCRLKDITDITVDTGLGQRFYGLIEQGMIEGFMTFKPDEKRLIFEEVAGTAKYRMRKRATIQKLDAAKLNLDRIEDIISEVEKRHQELEQEAARAVEYKKIYDVLKKVELFKNARDYRNIKASVDTKTAEGDVLARSIEDNELKVNTQETELEAKRNELFFIEKEFDEMNKVLAELYEKVETSQKEYYALKEGKNVRVAKIEELAERRKGITLSCEDLQKEIDALTIKMEEFEARLNEREKNLRAEEQQEEGLRNKLRGISDAIYKLQNELVKDKNQQAYYSSQIAYEEKIYNDTVKRVEVLNAEIQAEDAGIAAFKTELDKASAAYKEKEKEKQQTEAFIEDAVNRASAEKKSAGDLRKTLQDAEMKRERVFGAYNSSKKALEDYKGFSSGAQHVLKNFSKEDVLGSIVEHIDVKAEFITPFENYLKDKVELILVKDGATAKKAIDYLKQNKLGSCFLMPVDIGVRDRETADQTVFDHISVNDGVKDTIMRIFSKMKLVRDIDEALILYRTEGSKRQYVTMDGEVLDESGIIFGGSKEGHNTVIMEKKRVKDLETELKQLEKDSEELKSKLKGKEEEVHRLEESIRAKQSELQILSIELSSEEVELKHSEEELKRRHNKKENLGLELKNLNINLASYQKRKDEIAESSKKLAEQIAAGEQAVSGHAQELENTRKAQEQKTAELTAIKVSLAAEKSNFGHLRENANRLHEQKERMTAELEIVVKEEETLLALDTEAERRILQWQEEVAKLKTEQTEREEKQRSNNEKITNLRTELREREKALSALRTELEKTRKGLLSLKDKLNDLNLKLQLLVERIREKYFVDITRHFEEYLTWEVSEADCKDEKIEEQWKILRDMGEVNLLSIDEFEEVKKRYEFLKKQKADLEESIISLNEAIEKINKVSAEIFGASIKNIGEHFDRLFKRLFGGGKARILLTQEDNVLESGVDIAVELPHKKFQSIDLLSGGEKALVTLSLMFAFYMLKPSPFCILDEVDAPLDDANVNKFRDLLREMSKFSQFMIVTHNKIVMETASLLYGVTMETPGVSKVVSVKTHRE